MRKYCWISITLHLLELFSELTGIIMTPTRELALQIFRECKKFCKPLNLRAVCVYGGTGISEQVRSRILFYYL